MPVVCYNGTKVCVCFNKSCAECTQTIACPRVLWWLRAHLFRNRRVQILTLSLTSSIAFSKLVNFSGPVFSLIKWVGQYLAQTFVVIFKYECKAQWLRSLSGLWLWWAYCYIPSWATELEFVFRAGDSRTPPKGQQFQVEIASPFCQWGCQVFSEFPVSPLGYATLDKISLLWPVERNCCPSTQFILTSQHLWTIPGWLQASWEQLCPLCGKHSFQMNQ